jgi:hypothetical protein
MYGSGYTNDWSPKAHHRMENGRGEPRAILMALAE